MTTAKESLEKALRRIGMVSSLAEATIEELQETHYLAMRLGLKDVAEAYGQELSRRQSVKEPKLEA